VATLGLNQEIVKLLESLKNAIKQYTKHTPLDTSIIERITRLSKSVEEAREPYIATRDILENYMMLRVKLKDLVKAISQSGREYSMEELLSLVEDIENSVQIYLGGLKRNTFRESIVLTLPIFTAVFIYLVNLVVYALASPILLPVSIAILGLAVIAALLSKEKLILSYILIIASAVVGIAVSFLPGVWIERQLSILVYALIAATSAMYLQSIRMTRSKAYRARFEKAVNEIEKFANAFAKYKRVENKEKINELEKELLEIFRKLYGDKAETLLAYKVNVLVMHGAKREDALKRLLFTLKKTKKQKPLP